LLSDTCVALINPGRLVSTFSNTWLAELLMNVALMMDRPRSAALTLPIPRSQRSESRLS
jgi:hypothetical protein